MSLISIRVSEKLRQEMKAKAQLLHLTQTEYIKRAIEFMNAETEKIERKQRLTEASHRVRQESIKINKEFGEIEHDPDT